MQEGAQSAGAQSLMVPSKAPLRLQGPAASPKPVDNDY